MCPFMIQQQRISVYSIRLQGGIKRDKINDKYIFIGMTGNKNLKGFLNHFKNNVLQRDSVNHQTIRDRLTRNQNEKFYVNLLERFKYNRFSRERVVSLQNKYDVEIPYPES
jgi:hypothetical protein